MTGKELSVATGLPKLPDDRFFRISRQYGEDSRDDYGRWQELEPTGKAIVALMRRETKQATTFKGDTYSGYAHVPVTKKVLTTEKEEYQNWRGIWKTRFVNVVVQEPVMETVEKLLRLHVADSFAVTELRDTAQNLIDEQARWEAEQELLGDYPPHKLEG